MSIEPKKQPLHLIVGGSHGLGLALVKDSLRRNEIVHVVSRSEIPKPIKSSVFHTKCDLENSLELDEYKLKIRSLSGQIERITFCQRFRPPEHVSDSEIAIGTVKVELIATSEIIREVSNYKKNNKVSVVICSSINASLINKNLSLWYHVAKGANRQLMDFYSVSLESKGMFFSVIELGSFIKSKVVLDSRKTVLLEKLRSKSLSGHIPSDTDAARVIDGVHQLQLNGLSGQIYSYDSGISKIAAEDLLND